MKRQELVGRIVAAQGKLRRQFQTAIPESLQQEFADFGGITVHQMEVVRRVLLGERMSMSDVAAAQGIGPSGATQLVDRLERRGLVVRIRDEHDRRVQYVVPTDRAKEITSRFKSGVNRAATQLLAIFDDRELEIYAELTERIASGSNARPTRNARQADG